MLLYSLISYSRFIVVSKGELQKKKKIMFYANIMTSFSIWILFIYFVYHIILAKTCNTVLLEVVGLNILAFFLILGGYHLVLYHQV